MVMPLKSAGNGDEIEANGRFIVASRAVPEKESEMTQFGLIAAIMAVAMFGVIVSCLLSLLF